MTARDRTVLMVVGALALLAACWFALVAPKRGDLKDLDTQVTAAQQRLDTARQTAADAQRARIAYAGDYAAVARLGKAVPVDDDVPSLVYQLQHAAGRADVDFRSIQVASSGSPAPAATANATPAEQAAAAGATEQSKDGSSSTPSSTPSPSSSTAATPAAAPATQASASTLPPGATVGPAGFPTMPFDFRFEGRFFRLESFLRQLDAFTKLQGDKVVVRGRLLTVDGISLAAGTGGFPSMTAKIHATAYLLPEDEGLTNGATASGPAATPAASSGAPAASPASTATITGVTK